MINPSIFKSNDVRGIYPSDLTLEVAFKIGRAFIASTGARNVVICQDARVSSPDLFSALTAGILAEGAKVTSIGQLPTECMYFAVGSYDFDGGIMITASHNPKEYNGFKMVKRQGPDAPKPRSGGSPVSGDIAWVRGKDLALIADQFTYDPIAKPEGIATKDIMPDYTKRIFSLVDLGGVKKFKVVVDASNGVMGSVISKLALPVEIIPLNFTPDGNFPNHPSNPLEPGSSDQIQALIQKEKADFGIMFDGDADRIFLVDEHGELVSADMTLLLLAKYFIGKEPGVAVAYNTICSKAVPELIEKWGGKAVKTPVGFVYVREGLMQHQGVMGGELSGHYCFRDYFCADSGMITFLVLLKILSQSGKPVSEMIKEITLYAKSAEVNFAVEDKQGILEKVKKHYADGRQEYLDGVTVEYDNWWFNLRPSNTEPLLRLTVEADTEELLQEKKKSLSDFIQN